MVKPSFLKKGDRVGISAPGKRVLVHELESAREILTSWGLEVEFASALYHDSGRYLSGSDAHRLKDLQEMMDNPELSAILCARGGYGTTRIMDQLRFENFQNKPTWIAGFSDITALHLKLLSLGFESIHGTMPIFFANPGASGSVESLKRVLFGFGSELQGPPSENNRMGKFRGPVIGGNLSLLLDSMATDTEPDLDGKILIVEEIDEYLYKIDRLFTQMLRTGKLKRLGGLVIGHMSELKDTKPGLGESLAEIVLDKVSRFNYPVAFHFPTGHEDPNLAWIQGSIMTLNISTGGSTLRSDPDIS